MEDNDASLSIKVHDSSPQGDNVSNYMLPEELEVNISDVHKNSDKLLKMATNQTIKKEDKDGIDINQALSQSSKKGKVSIGRLLHLTSKMPPLVHMKFECILRRSQRRRPRRKRNRNLQYQKPQHQDTIRSCILNEDL
jgi:hypothetical protein